MLLFLRVAGIPVVEAGGFWDEDPKARMLLVLVLGCLRQRFVHCCRSCWCHTTIRDVDRASIAYSRRQGTLQLHLYRKCWGLNTFQFSCSQAPLPRVPTRLPW